MSDSSSAASEKVPARRVTVVVSENELRAWKLAAAFRGVSLSEWVRRVLSATAESQKGES